MTDSTLKKLIHDNADPRSIARFLDGLDHPRRLAEVNSLGRAKQAALFEQVKGQACVLERDFIPKGTPPLKEVTHHGKNSLPLFTRFQKPMCLLPRQGAAPVVFGFNRQAMGPLTGPGYFVAREAVSEEGIQTVVIDYTGELPTEKPEGWPKILPNSARLSRFVYYGTQDWMWRVSDHVTIGRARRASGWMNNWFVLCRGP